MKEEGSGERGKPQFKLNMPKFVEGDEVDVFIRSFEKLANLHKWKKAEWAVRLIPLLSGKALEAYSRLPVEVSDDYDVIKNAILERYKLTSEAYRMRFRNATQKSDESYKEYRIRIETDLDLWVERERVFDIAGMQDLILREQLINSTPEPLKSWLKEHKPKNANDLVNLADAYQLTHKGGNSSGFKKSVDFHRNRSNTGSKSDVSSGKGLFSKSDRTCYYCRRKGHIASECFLKKSQGQSSNINRSRSNDTKSKKTEQVSFVHDKDNFCDINSITVDVPVQNAECEEGTRQLKGLNIVKGKVQGHIVDVIRDTG